MNKAEIVFDETVDALTVVIGSLRPTRHTVASLEEAELLLRRLGFVPAAGGRWEQREPVQPCIEDAAPQRSCVDS